MVLPKVLGWDFSPHGALPCVRATFTVDIFDDSSARIPTNMICRFPRSMIVADHCFLGTSTVKMVLTHERSDHGLQRTVEYQPVRGSGTDSGDGLPYNRESIVKTTPLPPIHGRERVSV
jgi:hypothetical protein